MAKHDKAMIQEIKKEYETGGKSIAYLSGKYGVSVNTIKYWSATYSWVKSKPNKLYTSKEKDKQTNRTKRKKMSDVQEWERLGLTEREMLFAQYYIRDFNATQALKKVGQTYKFPDVEASKLRRRPRVKAYIDYLIKETRDEINLDTNRIIELYKKLAFYDLNDYIHLGSDKIEIIDKKGNKRKVTNSFVELKNDIDGQIITEISQGKDGLKVKLADRYKALDKLFEYLTITKKYEMEKLALEKQKNTEEHQEDGSIHFTFKSANIKKLKED